MSDPFEFLIGYIGHEQFEEEQRMVDEENRANGFDIDPVTHQQVTPQSIAFQKSCNDITEILLKLIGVAVIVSLLTIIAVAV